MSKKPARRIKKDPAEMTRGERVIAFIEAYCCAPEGSLVGEPIKLEPFQKKFILAVYDNAAGTSRAYLSMARKNGKTALIAAILLAHIAGPEAVINSQIVSGAMSREQAAIIFKLACKMINFSDDLKKVCRIRPSAKAISGITRNVEFQALSAEGKTAHGLSPILVILDEVGQVRGPQSDFVDALTTAQGAHDNPLIIAISTQAPSDADLFSIWIDDAIASKDPHTVCHVYTADKEDKEAEEYDLMDTTAWKLANPALGKFRSLKDLQEQAERAVRMPSAENTFRNLGLNQRIETVSPFISRNTWILNSHTPDPEAFATQPVFAGLDLSGKTDLTSMVLVAYFKGRWHVQPHFWTPEKGLRDRAKRDRAPYEAWAKLGFIRVVPGASVDYSFVVNDIQEIVEGMNIIGGGFDRWRFDLFKKEADLIGLNLNLEPFGQGFKDMAPAVDSVEELLLNEQMAHGANPVLTMCMSNARVEKDAAGNRKLSKKKATGRIDGAIGLTIATGIATAWAKEQDNVELYVL